MPDHREPRDRVAQQGLRVLQVQQDLAAETARLVLATQMAWWDLWVQPVLQANAASKVSRDRQDRTARLVRRGIPVRLARRGLRVGVGAIGPAGAPKRIERYTATSSVTGVATFTWPTCTAMPDIDVIPTWAGDQIVLGGVTAQTLSGATVVAKRSRGTLLLTAGPFEPAPSTPITVRVICN